MFESLADYGAPVLVLYILYKMTQEVSKWLQARKGNGDPPKAIETATKAELDMVLELVKEIKRDHDAISFARDPQGRPRAWFPAEPIEGLSKKIDALRVDMPDNDKIRRTHETATSLNKQMSMLIDTLKQRGQL